MNVPRCPFCKKEYMPQEPIRETVYYAQCDCQQHVLGENPEPTEPPRYPPPAPPEPKRMCDACKDSGFTDVPDEPGYVQTCLRCDHAALVKRVEALEACWKQARSMISELVCPTE